MSKTGYPDLTLENLAKTAGAFAAGGGAFVAGGLLEDKVRKRIARIKRFEQAKRTRRAHSAVMRNRKTMGDIATRHFPQDKTTMKQDIYNRFIAQEKVTKDQQKYDEARYRQQDPGPRGANDEPKQRPKQHDFKSWSQRESMRQNMQAKLNTGFAEDSRVFKEAMNPQKPANQNKPRRMGRGGGGIVNPTGLVGKAVEKFFKKV